MKIKNNPNIPNASPSSTNSSLAGEKPWDATITRANLTPTPNNNSGDSMSSGTPYYYEEYEADISFSEQEEVIQDTTPIVGGVAPYDSSSDSSSLNNLTKVGVANTSKLKLNKTSSVTPVIVGASGVNGGNPLSFLPSLSFHSWIFKPWRKPI